MVEGWLWDGGRVGVSELIEVLSWWKIYNRKTIP